MDFSLRNTGLSELMDESGCRPEEIRKALLFLRRLNQVGGSYRILAREVGRLNTGLGRVLDVGTGGGDVPGALLKEGATRMAIGLDTNPSILLQARKLVPEVPLIRGDAFQLPFPDQSFDTVLCHLFFHHLDEDQCVALLKEMVRVGRSVVVMDLARSRGLYYLVTALGWFSGSRLSRHDGPVSVRRAYTTTEITGICNRAGLDAQVKRHLFWRWTATCRQRPARRSSGG